MPFRAVVIPRVVAGLVVLAMLVAPAAPAHAQGGAKKAKKPAAAPRTGLLHVKVTVDGATIEVDGSEAGTSPLEAPIRLTVGAHAVKVSKGGYAEYLDTVKIGTNQTTSLEVDLLPFAAVVSVTTRPPGADVTVDGKLVGQSPLRTEVEAGQHELRVSLDGYHDAAQEIAVQAGQSYDLDLPLTALPPPPKPIAAHDAPIYKKWWFWAGAGVVAVGATALVIGASGSDDPLAGADKVIDVHF
jgi:hypothetical protein